MSDNNNSISSKLSTINTNKEKLFIEEKLLIEKGLNSSNINDIYASKKYQESLEKRTPQPPTKSLIIDPYHLNSSFGYREKSLAVNFTTLRAMSKVHLISAIIKTRISQISPFLNPQPNKYSTGFIVRKKSSNRFGITKESNSDEDQEKINYITDFLINGGSDENFFHGDDLSVFVSKLLSDSLSLDQATFEIIRDRKGELVEYFATDATTYRLTDESDIYRDQLVNGFPPHVVQLLDGRPYQSFYPWELCFGVRNPQTNIYKQGYGESELEILIKTVTSILNSDHYNANFFRVGSNPRGLLRYSGNINQNTLHELRQQWNATMTGVNNMHKVPFVNADKIDWISTHETNKDMEFGTYYEFLIKITCAVYTIDPSEIGFTLNGSGESKPLFEGNNEGRLKYSKDKGLRPLLKWLERIINKYLVSQIDKEYELEFVGFDELTEQNELDRDIKEVSNFSTLNEIREKRGQKPIAGGDIVLNSFFLQQKMSEMYAQQEQQGQGEGGEEYMENEEVEKGEDNNNPFKESLETYFKSLS